MTSSPPPCVLRDLASFGSGTTPSRARFADYYDSGTIPWVKTLDLNNGYIYRTDERITRCAVAETGIAIHPEGSVLVAMYGGFQQIGRTGLLTFPAATNQAITTIIPDVRRLAGSYLAHLLNYRVGDWRKVAISSRKDANITKDDVKKFTLVVPPLSQQHAIVEALDDVDGLISAFERAIAKKQAIKEGMVQGLLTGRTRLPGFTGRWSEVVVGTHATGLRGAGLSKELLSASGARPCILYGELFTTYGRRIDQVWSRTNADGGVRSQAGDVLVPGSTTTVARDLATASALHSPGVLLGGDINIVRPGEAVDPDWLAYYVTHRLGDRIAEIAQGTTIKHLYVRDLLTCRIVVPSVVEQRAIVAVLLDVEAEVLLLKLRVKKAREIKQGMMQELLTGRTRLPGTEVAA